MNSGTNSTKRLTSGLNPVETVTMAEMVETKLQDYFRDNDFKIGDAIPKEVELASALNVSRTVVREALSRFRMLGLIESRKKRGMILTSPDVLGGIERVMHPKLLSSGALKDMFQMRLVLEIGMAEMVFINKTDKDIIDLRRIVKKGNKVSKEKFDLNLEIEFHGRLYEIAKNPTVTRFQALLMPVFEYAIDYESRREQPVKAGSANHADIVEELDNGSADSFRKVMRRHLEPHFIMLKNW